MKVCQSCGGPTYRLGDLGKVRWYRCRNCGLDTPDESQDNKHYHVMGTLPGCMPDSNEVCLTMREARDYLRDIIAMERDQIAMARADGRKPYPRLSGNLRDGYYEREDSEYSSYLFYISDPCYEPECLEDLEA